MSRASSRASLAYLPGGGESLLLPDGPIGEEAAELLQEFVHPHHQDRTDDLVDADEGEAGDSDTASLERIKSLPWYKRPSPWWLLAMVPVSAAATGATMAPKVEIYTQLACATHRPEFYSDNGTLPSTYTYAPEYDPQLCAKDPVVQKVVAQMNLAMAITMGILTCLTTAWWGALSDRYGRIRTLSFAVFALLMTDVNFLVVARWHTVLPGGYWFLLVGPFLDGLLGGTPAITAAIHAYVADCTAPDERTHTFSLFLGLLFIGIGAGPTVGSVLIRLSGSVLSVFYLATIINLLYALLIIFAIPESLSNRRMIEARRVYREQLEEERLSPKAHGFGARLGGFFRFLRPLAVFYPTRVRDHINPLKRGKRDWNLLYIVLAYGFTISVMGAYPYKFQYTSVTFGWDSEQIGYWLTTVGVTRAVYLTVLLPLVIKLIKYLLRPSIKLPIEQDEPLQPASQPSTSSPRTESLPKQTTPTNTSRSIALDFGLARVSLVIEVISYALVPFASNGLRYTAVTVLGSFGAGFGPALQSVALGLYTLRGGTESGRLFGAMSVVQSLCSQVLGPALYGFTFMSTVRTFPAAIFLVTSASVLVAFAFLTLVRLPRAGTAGEEERPGSASEDEEEVFTPEFDTDVPRIVVEDAGGKAASSQSTPVL
ncbi:uncharacterized protein PHACADRAFT_255634 [Phanerochaete carnosa HHB-10118-sp]|uniref:Major facilitator superfamily (MFS) profile domain-containing protein n=1 Tax=Phanerochaete carnosa (strain HHB-10118-sp) TaxID=650164 RepID=K5W879_PHACS|nr:uncharacterized protein PHACADRAFT_255634 [Phanerochaete carnosa HHB-10118-sp]EKM55184.1 hypothetical protein PHACADRAFT_255634 [Phanerochaete carnosa HHB-10118-sp]